MILKRIRESTTQVVHHPRIRRFAPLLLFFATAVYICIGGSAFYLLENSIREYSVRKWYLNIGVNRRHFAKSISSRIFNDTRNLLIIIDREQTDRVQQLLVESLKRYEERLDISPPNKKDWNLLPSFNYAYSLLLTLGHGTRMPTTFWGQVFSTAYTIFGVPLFLGTIAIAVHQFALPLLVKAQASFARRLLVVQLGALLYLLWAVLKSLFLYYEVTDTYFEALQKAILSAFTIQFDPTTVTPCVFLILMAFSTVSVALGFLVAFLFLACYGACGIAVNVEHHDGEDLSKGGNDAPRFAVVVDEAGESRLADQ